MPELKARSAIVAMETSPLSEAQTARLLVAECHRISSEFSSALCECVILNKINEAEGRVLAVAEGLTPDSTSDFMKVPYARSDYLNGRSCEVTSKMSELLRELARCEPLVQLSVLGTMTELERREITSRLEAQDFKDGTVFMKQGWHGDAPVLTRTGYAFPLRPPACRTYRRRRAACPWASGMVREPYAYQPRACRTYRVLWHHRRRPLHHRARGGELHAAARPAGAKSAHPVRAALLERPSAPAPQRPSALPAPQRPSAPPGKAASRRAL